MDTVLEGHLQKAAGKTVFGNKLDKRWFVLTSDLLRYYTDEKLSDLRGTIPVRDICTVRTLSDAVTEKSGAKGLDVVTGDRTYKLYTATEEYPLIEDWHGSLLDVVNACGVRGRVLFEGAVEVLEGSYKPYWAMLTRDTLRFLEQGKKTDVCVQEISFREKFDISARDDDASTFELCGSSPDITIRVAKDAAEQWAAAFNSARVPDAPTDVTAAATLDPSVLEVAWGKPSYRGDEVNFYSISYVIDGSTCSVDTDDACLSFCIKDLHGGADVSDISVLAVSDMGRSDCSVPTVMARTAAGNPSPPLNISVQETGSSIMVSWEAPARHNGAEIASYTVEWELCGDAESIAVPAELCAVSIHNLMGGSTLEVKVYAENAIGRSDASSILSFTTSPSVPAPPRDLVHEETASSDVALSWKAPLQDGGSPIVEYEVSYSIGRTKMTTSTGSTKGHFVLDALAEEAVLCNVVVAARNSVGCGEASAPLEEVRVADCAGAATGVSPEEMQEEPELAVTSGDGAAGALGEASPAAPEVENDGEKGEIDPKTLCDECEETAASLMCGECGLIFCEVCCKKAHAKGKRTEHEILPFDPEEEEEEDLVLDVVEENEEQNEEWARMIAETGVEQDKVVPMEGYLAKQGGQVKNWKKRYFVLRDYVMYYHKEKDGELLGKILIPGYEVDRIDKNKKNPKKFMFKVSHKGARTFFFQAESAEEREEWIKAIRDQGLATEAQHGVQLQADVLRADRSNTLTVYVANATGFDKKTSEDLFLCRLFYGDQEVRTKLAKLGDKEVGGKPGVAWAQRFAMSLAPEHPTLSVECWSYVKGGVLVPVGQATILTDSAHAPYGQILRRYYTLDPGGSFISNRVSIQLGNAAYEVATVSLREPLPLPPAADKRTQLIQEIYTTELTFVEVLRRLVKQFIVPLRSPRRDALLDLPAMTSVEEVELLVSNVEDILAFNQKFLAALEQRVCCEWSDTATVGDLFVDLAPGLTVFHPFCSSYNDSISLEDRLRKKRRKLNAFLAQMTKYSQDLDMRSHLITVVQRVPRYRLFLEDLAKRTPPDHPDAEFIPAALEAIKKAASDINSALVPGS